MEGAIHRAKPRTSIGHSKTLKAVKISQHCCLKKLKILAEIKFQNVPFKALCLLFYYLAFFFSSVII